jgi:hypothetical protein
MRCATFGFLLESSDTLCFLAHQQQHQQQSDAFPAELDSDDNTLTYYGVCDGAEIIMNEIDLDAQRRESQRLVQERERKMMEQERDVTAMQELKRQNKAS